MRQLLRCLIVQGPVLTSMKLSKGRILDSTSCGERMQDCPRRLYLRFIPRKGQKTAAWRINHGSGNGRDERLEEFHKAYSLYHKVAKRRLLNAIQPWETLARIDLEHIDEL